MRRIGSLAAALGIGGLVAQASAQTIATVACHETTACRTESAAREPCLPIDRDGIDIVNGGWLKTDPQGRLNVVVLDPKLASVRSGFTMEPDTEVRVTADLITPGVESDRLVRLTRGGVLFTGAGLHAEAGECKATSVTTEFIMTYDPNSEIAKVVGVSGSVAVTNGRGEHVTVGVREMATVKPGAPLAKVALGDREYGQLVRRFQFVGGGRSESQAQRSALSQGAGLLPDDRAPRKGPSWVITDNGPDVADPPFDQPPREVEAARVGIEF